MRTPPFVDNSAKDVNSDWLADQWDERSVLGHVRIHKRKMKEDDPANATAQNPKHLDGGIALLKKFRKTFTDSFMKKEGLRCFLLARNLIHDVEFYIS